MDRLLKILSPTLGPMAAQVLDGATLHVRDLVLEDKLDGLNRQRLVVTPTNLDIQCRHGSFVTPAAKCVKG